MTDIERADTTALVQHPGKFEGERQILEIAYDQYLNGFCDDDGGIVTVEVPVAWRGTDRVPCEWETIRFVVDEQGFVSEVPRAH